MESDQKPANDLPEEDEQARIKRLNKQMTGLLFELGWKSMAVAATFGLAAAGYGAYKWYKNRHPSESDPAKDDTTAPSPASGSAPKPQV